MKSIRNNRWHIRDYPDLFPKITYIEWKYFNFCSPEYSGIIVYLIFDPLNISGMGEARVFSRVFTKNEIFKSSDKRIISEISISKKDAGVKIGKNIIQAGMNKYKIIGKSKIIEWDLDYFKNSLSVRGFSNLEIDPLGIERANWFVAMPKAKVRGHIKIKGKKINIDATGYADSNWGIMFPLFTRFDWAQYNDEKICIVGGEMQHLKIKNKKLGRWAELFINYKNKKISFKENEFKIKHLEWSFLSKNRIKYPSMTLLKAENKDYKISLLLKTRYCDLIDFEMPFLSPIIPVVAEQVVSFQGEFISKKGEKNVILHSINGDGFKEYSFRDISIKKFIKKML